MRAPPLSTPTPPLGSFLQLPRTSSSALKRAHTEDIGSHRPQSIVKPVSRAMTTPPEPPRMAYCPRSAQDNFNTLSQLGNIIFSISMGLAPKLTRFPGFYTSKRSNSRQSEILSVMEPQSKRYEEAFYAKGGEKHSKPYAIAAIIAAYVWDCIQEYRIFTEDAARDLQILANLTSDPPVVTPVYSQEFSIHHEQDEEIYAARMFYEHGAGKELQSKSKAAERVSKEMRTLYKHLFGKEGDDEARRLVEKELGKEVWRYAMELKNQKGRIDITFNPDDLTSRYCKTLFQSNHEVAYFEEQPYRQIRQRSVDKLQLQNSPGRTSSTSSASSILWFPEVTLYRKALGFSDAETAVIFKSKHSRDLEKLIERGDQFLSSRRSSRDTTASRGFDRIPPRANISVKARVAASKGARDSSNSSDLITPITESHDHAGDDNHPVSYSQPQTPPKAKTHSSNNVAMNGRSMNSNEPGHIMRPTRLEKRSSPSPDSPAPGPRFRTNTDTRSSEGGIFSKIIKLIMSIFKPKPRSNMSTYASAASPNNDKAYYKNNTPTPQFSKGSRQHSEKHGAHHRNRP